MLEKIKGFSFIRLVIVILMITIVGIISFFVVSEREWNNVNSEMALQTESQQAVSQMKNLIVDAGLGVNYKITTDRGDYFVLNEQNPAISGEILSKTLYLIKTNSAGQVVAGLMRWEENTKEITYQEKIVDQKNISSVREIESETGTWETLKTGTESFSVNLHQNGNKIKFSVEFIEDERSYSIEDTVAFRNDVLIGEDSIDVLTEGIEGAAQNIVTEVGINVKPAIIAPGGGCSITKKLEGTGDMNLVLYKWQVSNDPDMETLLPESVAKFQNDNLVISDLDSLKGSIYIRVVADADMDGNLENDSDDLMSQIEELKIIKGITVSIKDAGAPESTLTSTCTAYTATAGETYNMLAKIDSEASLSNVESRMKWSIVDCSSGIDVDSTRPDVSIDSDGKLVIDKSCKKGTFKVVASLAENPSISVTYPFSVSGN